MTKNSFVEEVTFKDHITATLPAKYPLPVNIQALFGNVEKK